MVGTNGELALRVPTALPNSENGWPFPPFQIVSLLDLKKYHLIALQGMANIGFILYDHQLGGYPESFEIKKDDTITPEHLAKFNAALDYHEKHYKYLDLKLSLKYVKTLRELLGKTDCTYGEYQQAAEVLQGRLDDEMEEMVFGFIPATHKEYFQNKELFGAEVNSKFPDAAKDIKEAGNCYANGNYTASVFHLMRVLEIALQKLATDLGVTFPTAIELENWQNIIEKIESAMRDREKQLPKGTQKSVEMQYYSEAAKEFRYFKDAWRNHVSHSRVDYEVHDATKIMEHVREFMQHLASKK